MIDRLRPRGRLPSFVVIGAMKAGTTSLHGYLQAHPDVCMAPAKELDFFVEKYNWGRGLEWYRARFPRGPEVACGEASPNYTNYPRSPEVPRLMHAVVPEAKLIYLVRDPIARMVSHYVHKRCDGSEHLPLEEALLPPERKSYLHRSMYHLQLQRFLDYYPRERVLVVASEDLQHRREEALRSIFTFLGVDPGTSAPSFELRRHRSASKRPLTPFGRRLARGPVGRFLRRLPALSGGALQRVVYRPFTARPLSIHLPVLLRRRLADLLTDDVTNLRKLTGQTFPHWTL